MIIITIKDNFSKLTLGTNWVRRTKFHIDNQNDKKRFCREIFFLRILIQLFIEK